MEECLEVEEFELSSFLSASLFWVLSPSLDRDMTSWTRWYPGHRNPCFPNTFHLDSDDKSRNNLCRCDIREVGEEEKLKEAAFREEAVFQEAEQNSILMLRAAAAVPTAPARRSILDPLRIRAPPPAASPVGSSSRP